MNLGDGGGGTLLYYMSHFVYTCESREHSSKEFEDAVENNNGMICVKLEGKWAVADNDLNLVTGWNFTDVVRNSKGQVFEGNYAVVKDDGGYFAIDSSENDRFKGDRYAEVKGFEGGPVAVRDKNGIVKFVDVQGETYLELTGEYSDASSFSCDTQLFARTENGDI